MIPYRFRAIPDCHGGQVKVWALHILVRKKSRPIPLVVRSRGLDMDPALWSEVKTYI